MIDHASATNALRSRATTLTVATTGALTLTATTSGYTRADAGSFLTDGFAVGMEITPTGFTSNPADVITGVTASTLTVLTARSAEGASAGRTIAAGVPATRAWENLNRNPSAQRPYIEDSFVPATSRLLSFPVTNGTVEETGLYVLTWYTPANTGSQAIRKSVTALAALFAMGTVVTTSNSDVIRVRSDVGPSMSALLPIDGGWTCCTLTIPWRSHSINLVAA